MARSVVFLEIILPLFFIYTLFYLFTHLCLSTDSRALRLRKRRQNSLQPLTLGLSGGIFARFDLRNKYIDCGQIVRDDCLVLRANIVVLE